MNMLVAQSKESEIKKIKKNEPSYKNEMASYVLSWHGYKRIGLER